MVPASVGVAHVGLPSSGDPEAVTIELPATSAHDDAVVAEHGTAVHKIDSALASDIRGFALVQVVEHDRAGVTYPVVADPAVSYCTVGGWNPAQCFKWTRAETRAAGAHVDAGAGAAVDMCSATPGPVGAAFPAVAQPIAGGMRSENC